MLLSEILLEGRDAPLYHATGPGNALFIIENNEFKPRTSHSLKKVGLSDHEEGISLSRNIHSARLFGDVVFELDQRKLSQNYRMIPFDYWGLSNEPENVGLGRRKERYAEAEEFVIGPIKNASRYITAIHISQRTLKYIKEPTTRKSRLLIPETW